MEYIIETMGHGDHKDWAAAFDHPGEFWTSIKIDVPYDGTIIKSGRAGSGGTAIARQPVGKWSPTREQSILELKKSIMREIRNLEKVSEPRPSQVRRMELLRGAIDFLNAQ